VPCLFAIPEEKENVFGTYDPIIMPDRFGQSSSAPLSSPWSA
jgi:hypothetical protein